MIAYINAAAMEAIKIVDYNPARSIFYVAEDIALAKKLDYMSVLKQIGKIDKRYECIIELVSK